MTRSRTIDNMFIDRKDKFCHNLSSASFINQVRYMCEENNERCNLGFPLVKCKELKLEGTEIFLFTMFNRRIVELLDGGMGW